MSGSLRKCQHCGRDMPRGNDAPYRYARRKFCSKECTHADFKGRPSPLRQDEPIRVCERCGKEYGRRVHPGGVLEPLRRYRTRRYCSPGCATSAQLDDRYARDPSCIGLRTLVAKTCSRCGELRPAEQFLHVSGGYYDSDCTACKAGKRESYYRSRQSTTDATAERKGQEWTGAEMELVATRNDLTIAQLAQMLGRTYAAVSTRRSMVRHRNREKNAAGVSRSTSP